MVLVDPCQLVTLAWTGRCGGISLIDAGPPIAAQDGGDGGVRPSGMLSHGRGDGDTFGGHQGHGVNGDGERVGHGGIEHLEREMRSVVSPLTVERTAGLSMVPACLLRVSVFPTC